MKSVALQLGAVALLLPFALGADLAGFEAALSGDRGADAQVVGSASAYLKLVPEEVGVLCTNPLDPWAGVGLRITNDATTEPLNLVVTETADPDNLATHSLSGSQANISQTRNVTLTLDKLAHPACHDDTHTVTYRVNADDPAVLRAEVRNVQVTVRMRTL